MFRMSLPPFTTTLLHVLDQATVPAPEQEQSFQASGTCSFLLIAGVVITVESLPGCGDFGMRTTGQGNRIPSVAVETRLSRPSTNTLPRAITSPKNFRLSLRTAEWLSLDFQRARVTTR